MRNIKIQYLISLPKTLYFNLYYLPLRDALLLPIFVSHRVKLLDMKGKVELKKVKTGSIKIGFTNAGIICDKTPTIWECRGRVTFNGSAKIGTGSALSINGNLIFGDGFNNTAKCNIICNREIKFGENVLVSWDTQFMDTDFHKILDKENLILNPDSSIVIGDNVWVGCRVSVFKGVSVESNNVIGACSVITKNITSQNQITVGNPQKTIRRDISWEY